jgi:hypothetical protein
MNGCLTHNVATPLWVKWEDETPIPNVATTLWVKWEDEIPAPKVGNLESSGTPECLEFNSKEKNTLH